MSLQSYVVPERSLPAGQPIQTFVGFGMESAFGLPWLDKTAARNGLLTPEQMRPPKMRRSEEMGEKNDPFSEGKISRRKNSLHEETIQEGRPFASGRTAAKTLGEGLIQKILLNNKNTWILFSFNFQFFRCF